MQVEVIVSYESVWDGTKAHNGGLLMAAAEERPMAKELITRGSNGWGFETLDGRKSGYPTRDAARAARKEWMDADAAKKESDIAEKAKAIPFTQVDPKPFEPKNLGPIGVGLAIVEAVVHEAAVAAAPAPVKKTGRSKVTPEEVAAVLSLRAAGMSFQKIEAELGWDDFHGCKARRVVLDNQVK
jgi:hypothetical protein